MGFIVMQQTLVFQGATVGSGLSRALSVVPAVGGFPSAVIDKLVPRDCAATTQ